MADADSKFSDDLTAAFDYASKLDQEGLAKVVITLTGNDPPKIEVERYTEGVKATECVRFNQSKRLAIIKAEFDATNAEIRSRHDPWGPAS